MPAAVGTQDSRSRFKGLFGIAILWRKKSNFIFKPKNKQQLGYEGKKYKKKQTNSWDPCFFFFFFSKFSRKLCFLSQKQHFAKIYQRLRGCLVSVFKQQFSVFKQHFTYFHTLFHPHIFPQKFLNNNFQFLNTCTKRALNLPNSFPRKENRRRLHTIKRPNLKILALPKLPPHPVLTLTRWNIRFQNMNKSCHQFHFPFIKITIEPHIPIPPLLSSPF